MAYTYEKQLWKDYPDTTTPITADRLNHMEEGIKGLSDAQVSIEVVDSLDGNSTTNAPSVHAVNEAIGKIIESGDGYIKYSDGTMICYDTSDITAQITNPWGSGYYGNVKINPTFAKTFISPPTISANVRTANNLAIVAGISTSTIKITTIFLITFASQSSYTGKLDWVAIGKWK